MAYLMILHLLPGQLASQPAGLSHLQVDNSYISELEPDPEQTFYEPNQDAREVVSGHYVLVRPTPLPRPRLVACSPRLLEDLGVPTAETNATCYSEEFLQLFSGDIEQARSQVPQFDGKCG